eukprot:CAMPEP_0196770152 /NCGR_PEP_ID=MMETSP1104-20130614/973_1 /TAXON_ID=33652 /ORGANISM="Cafeteria sp., Strain Caron Lab Isolate" /LENGTH=190 /DNA_ID=CAMNT_0042140261 /DNA_START=1 /DNA_END=573 /DNA_ORIENTATION=+
MRFAAKLLAVCAVVAILRVADATGPESDDEALIRALEKQDAHAKAKKTITDPYTGRPVTLSVEDAKALESQLAGIEKIGNLRALASAFGGGDGMPAGLGGTSPEPAAPAPIPKRHAPRKQPRPRRIRPSATSKHTRQRPALPSDSDSRTVPRSVRAALGKLAAKALESDTLTRGELRNELERMLFSLRDE